MRELYIWKLENDMALTFVDMIQQFDTLMWTPRFATAGEFEIYVSNTRLMKYVGNNYMISRDRFGKDVMFIEACNVKKTSDGTVYCLTGRDMLSILDRRVYSAKKANKINGKAGSILRLIVINNVRAEQRPERSLPISVPTFDVQGQEKDYVLELDSILNITTKICEEEGIGQSITRVNGQLTYNVIYPEEKSVIFSRELGNLIETELLHDTKNHFNVGYFADSPNNMQVFYDKSTYEPTGINRYEQAITVDFSQDDVGSYGDYISAATCKTLRRMKANEDDVFRCEVDPNGVYQFGKDYNLGDIVTIDDGVVKAKVKVVEAIESDDISGYRLVLTLETKEIIRWQ